MTTPIRRAPVLATLGILTVGGLIAAAVLAEDPHNAPATGSFDINSPRHVPELTAKYIGLETAEADFGAVESVVRLTGTVRPIPDLTSIVTSAVQGTIVRLDVRIGDHVKRGQPIGVIQSSELARMVIDLHKAEIEAEHVVVEITGATSNIAQLRNQITTSETQARLLEDELARAEASGDPSSAGAALSANAVAAKRSAAIQARAQVSTLTLSLAQAERTLISLEKVKVNTAKSIVAMQSAIDIIHAHPPDIDMAAESKEEGEAGGTFVLHARIDGIVTHRDAVPGQGVEAGKAILTIVDYSQVLIEGELPESLIATFSGENAGNTGQEVRIRRPGSPAGDAPIAVGAVKGLSPTVDPIKRTAHLLISAPNPAGRAIPTLQEGMFVSLAVVTSPGKQAVVIPVSALLADGPTPFVFIKDGDAFVKRDILPGARNDRQVEVKEGLVPGDVVVTRGAYLLTQFRPAGAAPDHDEHDHGHSH
jgi:multidrug efflux pump subunit AcrA (membrane-fusion protein)